MSLIRFVKNLNFEKKSQVIDDILMSTLQESKFHNSPPPYSMTDGVFLVLLMHATLQIIIAKYKIPSVKSLCTKGDFSILVIPKRQMTSLRPSNGTKAIQ